MKMQFVVAAVTAALFAGCSSTAGNDVKNSSAMVFGNEKNIKKELVVDNFSKIRINGGAEVKFVQTSGEKPRVYIEGRAKNVENTKVVSENDALQVSQTGNVFINWDGGNVVVTVYAPDLTSVEINGSGDFDAAGKVDTDNLSIRVKGSGEVDFADVICDDASIEIYGSGDVGIGKLTAQHHTDISVKGSGDVDVEFWHSGSVDCTVTGSGDVTLKGSAKSLRKYVVGSGDISSEKLKKW